MKAPKEIYVHIRTEPRPSLTFSEVEEKNCENIKYLRADLAVEKEKLLEYLETQLNTLSSYYDLMKTVTLGGGTETYGKIIFCKQVIEKLKTL